MRYTTDYMFDEEGTIPNEEQVKQLESITGYSHEDEGDLYGSTWTDFEQNMIEFSELYPEDLWVILGDGEETEDTWKHYFKNGKQFGTDGEITFIFVPFEESYLK